MGFLPKPPPAFSWIAFVNCVLLALKSSISRASLPIRTICVAHISGEGSAIFCAGARTDFCHKESNRYRMENHRYAFRGHGSSFGQNEEEMLKINITETDDSLKIFSAPLDINVPDYLKHLELENFGLSNILAFSPHDHPQLSKSQRLFLRHVQDVLYNRLDSSSRFQLYIRDLVDLVIRESQLDDGLVLYVRESKLSLVVGSKKHIVFSDKEGKRLEEHIWLLQESKHKFDTRYKQGDVQLVVSMIAACQNNFAKRRGVLAQKVLYGIKVLGEEFYFYRIEFEEDYLKQLAEHLPNLVLNVYKYPRTHGLRIAKPDDRKKILSLLYRLREYALYSTGS